MSIVNNPDYIDNYNLERRARALVIARNVYKTVVALWTVASAGMLVIWWLTTPSGYFWPIWPILGMSIAAVIWGLAIYGKAPFRARQDQVEREMERLRTSSRQPPRHPGIPQSGELQPWTRPEHPEGS